MFLSRTRVHKLFLSNSSPSENGGLQLVPHTASLRCEAGVFLSKLILLPSTYSRSAWEVSEQVGTFNPSCPKYYCNVLHSSHSLFSPVWVKVMLLNSFSNLNFQVFVVRSGVGTLFSFICPQLINKLQPSTSLPT